MFSIRKCCRLFMRGNKEDESCEPERMITLRTDQFTVKSIDLVCIREQYNLVDGSWAGVFSCLKRTS